SDARTKGLARARPVDGDRTPAPFGSGLTPRDSPEFAIVRRPATRRRCHRPTIDALEGRLLLYSTFGGGWQKPVLVTYSFAPDGTSIGGIPSTLNQAMGARGISTASWQQAIQKAAAIWQAVANINLVQVSDDGSPF